MENFFKRVSAAQIELKAPKSQYNSFGKYHYRNCEDILEAAKPICNKHGLLLNLSDKVVNIGDRYYVEATATLYDTESEASLSSTASAREAEQKKGMDESQVTGTASSYARKYALNGLFNIDDTKDADSDEFRNQSNKGGRGKPDFPPAENIPGPREKPAPIFCSRCKHEVTAHKAGGKEYAPAEIKGQSEKKYGVCLCWNCMVAMKAAAKRNAAEQGEQA